MAKIYVILGSTRENRFSEKPANWIFDKLKTKQNVQVELIDLRDWPLPFYNEPFPPMTLAGNYSNSLAKKWVEKIKEGDAFIFVTPEYNHGYPAVLKNALDWVYFEWNYKPAGFVSWGSAEGARSVEQLRQVAIELRMFPIRDWVSIKEFYNLTDENGNLKQNAFEPFEKQADVLLNQIIFWAEALKSIRKNLKFNR